MSHNRDHTIIMSQITIILPDNSTKVFDHEPTALEVAQSIGPRLAKETLGAKILSSVNKKLDYLVIGLSKPTKNKVDKAKELGLNIIALEDDEALQDAILSVHHCYMHTFQNTQAVKINDFSKRQWLKFSVPFIIFLELLLPTILTVSLKQLPCK